MYTRMSLNYSTCSTWPVACPCMFSKSGPFTTQHSSGPDRLPATGDTRRPSSPGAGLPGDLLQDGGKKGWCGACQQSGCEERLKQLHNGLYVGADVQCRFFFNVIGRFRWTVLQMYILRFFRAVIDQQTWTDDGSVSERRLRSAVLSLACRLGDPQCVDRAHKLFKDWLRSNGTVRYVHPNCV